MPLPVESALWMALLGGEILLLLRLVQQGLWRRYPCFFGYIAFEAVGWIVLIQIPLRSVAYSSVYRAYAPLNAIAKIAVVVELYARVCEHFPGIGRFRISLAGALLCLALSFAGLMSVQPSTAERLFPQTVLTEVRRFEGLLAGAALLLVWVFFRYVVQIQLSLKPNVRSHWKITTLYFCVSSASASAILMFGRAKVVHASNVFLMTGQIACCIAWLQTMRRSGERPPTRVHLSPTEIADIEQQDQELTGLVRSLPLAVRTPPADSRAAR